MDKPESKRIFINHVDTYLGNNLAQYLHKCVVGASLDEDEEEEENTEEIEGYFPKKDFDNCYEIHGSLKSKTSKKPTFVRSILQYDTKEEFFEHVVEFDVIIYDITNDIDQIEEALWVANRIHDSFQWLAKEVTFILLSTVMTWAKTKPADPDDQEATITEEDMKRRKPHPNFKEQFNAEKEMMKLSKKHKSKIKTYVVVAGICYGCGEHMFHDFYQQAWNNGESLTIYGNGTNVIPTIHVLDLAGVIQNVADSKPDGKYIIALDDSKNNLEEIVQAISLTLSNGKTKKIPKEQALVDNLIQQNDLEILLLDLKLDSAGVKEEMKIKWVAESGLVENIEILALEYRKSRNLLPLKVLFLGPPSSGKTYYCEKISKEYKLKHLILKDVISSYMANLDEVVEYPTKLAEEIEAEKAALAASGEEEAVDAEYRADELEEAKTKAETATETKERFMKNMDENAGRLFDEDLALIYKETLMRKDCLNHGFILDGFPKTKEQANLLFVVDAEDGEEEENVKAPRYNVTITPQNIFVIEASDNLLTERHLSIHTSRPDEIDIIMALFKKRLATYRALNDDLEAINEDTILTYFDLRDLYPVILKLHDDLTKEWELNRMETLKTIYYELGKPHIYPPDEDELALIRIKEAEDQLRKEELERENSKIKEAEMLTIRKHNQTEWNENLELVKKEMYEYLETQSLPLRNYLMHLVMPVLSEGLIDCSKVRTEDPIDFLSEFILRSKKLTEEEETE